MEISEYQDWGELRGGQSQETAAPLGSFILVIKRIILHLILNYR